VAGSFIRQSEDSFHTCIHFWARSELLSLQITHKVLNASSTWRVGDDMSDRRCVGKLSK